MQLKNNNFKHYLIIGLIYSAISITSIALIIQFTSASFITNSIKNPINNPYNLWTPVGAWANIWNSISTFTIQSNILVLIFFILVLINYITAKIKWINGYSHLAVTVYITITMIIFWVALFKPMLKTTNFESTFGIINFINTFLLHLISPIITITYYLLSAGQKKWSLKKSSIKAFPLSLSYMFIYLSYALIKGSFVGQIKFQDGSWFSDYSYPYFFLNIKTNLTSFFLYFFIILFLFLLLFTFYYAYNNWKYYKNYRLKLENKKELIKAILI